MKIRPRKFLVKEARAKIAVFDLNFNNFNFTSYQTRLAYFVSQFVRVVKEID